MARPSKLNEQLIEEFAEWVADDCPYETCCDGVGITYNSFYNWMKQGEEDYENDVDSLYSTFFKVIKKTYAECKRKSIAVIKSGRPGWQGEAWVRERRDKEFMPKQEFISNDDKVIINLGPKQPNRHTKVDEVN